MIRGGKVIPWLIENLSEPDNLSEYLLEYAAALLMNLCLRTTGRCSLLNETENLLRVLTDLLSHENQNFKTYLNGTLYSVLKMDKFKEKARAMGLKGLLDSYMKREQPDSEHYTVYRIIIFSLFFKYTYIATRLYQKRNWYCARNPKWIFWWWRWWRWHWGGWNWRIWGRSRYKRYFTKSEFGLY